MYFVHFQVTLRQIQQGASMSLQDVLQMEYRIAVRCMHDKDFFEGVRAGIMAGLNLSGRLLAMATTFFWLATTTTWSQSGR